MIRLICLSICFIAFFLIQGCVAPIDGLNESNDSVVNYAKQFNSPPRGWAGLYIYRECGGLFAANLYKRMYIDGQFFGYSSRCRFFHRLVKPGIHVIQTDSDNIFTTNFVEGENTYVKASVDGFSFDYIFEIVPPEQAQAYIVDAEMSKHLDGKEKNLESFSGDSGKGSIPGHINADLH